ncbi:3'(2'),5'-bisphosphate nucleotidase CysQ [uncultured Mucilaginibacter sp.]|uniref:3'(2'),5'-bisphosphate nucleotidase CysQ n=1 Tax=uncultured Mucilaginibacter sp. TaxID=797541 RepID=UPI0025E08F4A|nr:3'(2'),5'-bisphosphate nucleotidase CysQ [uncultured Mucilaginibacter sp.]
MCITIDINSVLDIAVAAGHAIMTIYDDPEQDFNITSKEDSSPLTIADQVSHELIYKGLTKLCPQIPIISEEGKHTPYEVRKNWASYWCVDPLDGTKEFIKRNGEFTVNIALIHKQVPVLGVIYIPTQNLLYYGDSTSGSWKQTPGEEPLQIKADKSTHDWIAVGSRSHSDSDEDEVVNQYPVVNFVAVGSSIKFCMIAEGKAHLYFRSGPTMEWDTAAGQAIAHFSGCTVETLAGQPLFYNKPSMLNDSFLCKINTDVYESEEGY